MIVLWIKEIYDCTQKNMNYEITSDTDLKKFKELDQREILDRYIFNFEQKTWYIYIYIYKNLRYVSSNKRKHVLKYILIQLEKKGWIMFSQTLYLTWNYP
jgi:hypothetical protein